MAKPTSALTANEERGLVSHVNPDNPTGPLMKHRGNPLVNPESTPKPKRSKTRKKKS